MTTYEAITLGIAISGLVLVIVQTWTAMKQGRKDNK